MSPSLNPCLEPNALFWHRNFSGDGDDAPSGARLTEPEPDSGYRLTEDGGIRVIEGEE